MTSLAAARLAEERKNWRKDHPFGFVAKPSSRPDGSVDIHKWQCVIPGKEGTYCEGGKYPCHISFPADYPMKHPMVYFPKGFFHVNVFDNGAVCLSILKDQVPNHLGNVSGWKPSITVKEVLLAVQELLHNPNFGSVANQAAWMLRNKSEAAYIKKMKEQAKQYAETGED